MEIEGRNDLLISFDALVAVEEREDYWAAQIDPIGMVVYGDTREEVEQRVSEAVEFFLKNTPDVRQYLDYHNVPHQARYASAEGTGRADRRILPVIARIENRVLA